MRKNKMKMKPKFIEVCAGCGGLSLGFIQSGFETILLNEIDKNCIHTLKTNHTNINIDEGSMCNLSLIKYKKEVDILMGGMPCQAFSQSGKRLGFNDPRGQLILEFNRLINECEPKMILVENVKGLRTHNKGDTLKEIIKEFENNGKYRISTAVLNSVNYEVPQKRERIFIIGVLSSIKKEFEFPQPIKRQILLKDVLKDVPTSVGIQYSEKKKNVLELVPQGGCWVDLPKKIQEEYVGDKMLKSGGGKRGIARRLSMEEPSLTLLTSPCQKQTDRCHPLETRPLNIREYARIQTFPDTYEFKGSITNQYKQIGNAVPVNLAYHMAKEIFKFLESID